MKAVTYQRYGPPSVLRLSEVEKPIPKDNELLIRIHAAEATKADCEFRSFKFAVSWFWLPLRIASGIRKPRNPILGTYFSGTIESVGKEVTNFHEGEEVFGSSKLRQGAYGEYLCLPDNYTIVRKPRNIDHTAAAAVPLGGLNALHFMRLAKVQAGSSILINGAGGSIGIFAIQIAKEMGATVTAVDAGHKRDMLLKLGIERFIDFREASFLDEDKHYNAILDMVPGSDFKACLSKLYPSGIYMTGNPRFMTMLKIFGLSKKSGIHASFAFAGETVEELLHLKSMLEEGRIHPVIDQTFPLQQAAVAHERVETEQRQGSVVLIHELHA